MTQAEQIIAAAAKILGVPVEDVRLNQIEVESVTGRRVRDFCIEQRKRYDFATEPVWSYVCGNSFNHWAALEELRRRGVQREAVVS